MRSLEDHLSPQELASLPESQETLASGAPNQQQLALHLLRCEHCSSTVQTYSALRRLSKPAAPDSESKACPSQIVWLELAAGIRYDDSLSLLAHAGCCDDCAVVLREALALMKDDSIHSDQVEEFTEISDLASSTAAWQSSLVDKLLRTGTSERIMPPKKVHWGALLGASLSPLRLTFAMLFVVLLAFGMREHRDAESLSTQLQLAKASIPPLELELRGQERQIAQLKSQSDNSRATPLSPFQLLHEENAATLELRPGLTRGPGQTTRLKVPPGTKFVEITLHQLNISDGTLREELLTADGQLKWSQELRPPDFAKKSGTVSLSVPAYLLTPNDYEIVVKQKSNGSFEKTMNFNFRVN